MNNTTYWIIGILGVLGLVLVAWFVWPSASEQSPDGSTGGGYPQDVPYVPYSNKPGSSGSPDSSGANSSNAAPVALATQSGEMYQVKNFLKNGTTVKDTVNPGYYVLAGDAGYCLANGQCIKGAPSDEYFISYNMETNFFNISLLKEPIAQSRANAEKFMMQTLGLSQTQLCGIKYYVTVASSVNPIYAGQNLGWSFCPGAVKL